MPDLPGSTDSNGATRAKRSLAGRCTRGNSNGRRGTRTADTSRSLAQVSAVDSLEDVVHNRLSCFVLNGEGEPKTGQLCGIPELILQM